MADDYYVKGPDGLPARRTGFWMTRKALYVDRYVDMFATSMRDKWSLAYVELFAGPGMSQARETLEFQLGSAVRAIEHPFSRFVYVDADPIAVGALQLRLLRRRPWPRPWHVIQNDCNDAIDEIRSRIPSGALTLAFVDPNGWEIRFESIRRLVDGRRVDLLFTFHAGSMRRQWDKEAPDLTAFFGTEAWRHIVRDAPEFFVVRDLVRLYGSQLVGLGYQPCSEETLVAVRNSKNALMYVLVLFSKNRLGLDFWRKGAKDRFADLRAAEDMFGL